MHVRDATEADLPGILAINNEVIATSTAVFSDRPVTLEERQAWFAARAGQGYTVLAATGNDGSVLGFASFGDFRAWPGYRYTVEHSVHVGADARGRGIGSALMPPLLERAASLGKHVVVAGINADNAGLIRMHERLGFERTGHLRQVGRKFDRWLDLVLMQRFLG